MAAAKKRIRSTDSGLFRRFLDLFFFPLRLIYGLFLSLYWAFMGFWDSVPMAVGLGAVFGLIGVLVLLLVLAAINEMMWMAWIVIAVIAAGFVLLVIAGAGIAVLDICLPTEKAWVRRVRSLIGALALGATVGFMVFAYVAGNNYRNVRTGQIVRGEAAGAGAGFLTAVLVAGFAFLADNFNSGRRKQKE